VLRPTQPADVNGQEVIIISSGLWGEGRPCVADRVGDISSCFTTGPVVLTCLLAWALGTGSPDYVPIGGLF